MGRLDSPIRGVISPGSALGRNLPNCPGTSLQSLYRHWTTSFRFVELTFSVTQIFCLSKQNEVVRADFSAAYGYSACKTATHCAGRSFMVSSRRGLGLGAFGSGGGGFRVLSTHSCASAQPSPGGGGS